jgi:phosphatidylserine decarboxylase
MEPPMKDALIVTLLSVIPRNRVGSWLGWLARRVLPRWLNDAVLRGYVRYYDVAVADAEYSLAHYSTLSDFFVRKLRPGLRPICDAPDALVSPVDGLVASCGVVTKASLPQSPLGRTGTPTGPLTIHLPTLLNNESVPDGSSYAVLYLAPPDYHRVHSPVSARLMSWAYVPGRLFPVFSGAAARVKGLFARNERLVAWFEGPFGRLAVVMIGAFGVGRMTVAFTDLVTNTGGKAHGARCDPDFAMSRGDEFGVFHLGSTVILVFDRDAVSWEKRPGDRVVVGERIGTFRAV